MGLMLISSKEADKLPCPLLSLSVMHSGTRFFAELLQPSHIKHLHQDTAIEKVIERAGTVYCTLRKPEEVLKSWYRRHSGRITASGDPSEVWEKSWKVLADVSERFPIWFLPIDHPSRDERFAALAKHLKKDVKPDWDHVVGASGGSANIPKRVKTDWIYDIPIIRELYGSKPKKSA